MNTDRLVLLEAPANPLQNASILVKQPLQSPIKRQIKKSITRHRKSYWRTKTMTKAQPFEHPFETCTKDLELQGNPYTALPNLIYTLREKTLDRILYSALSPMRL